MEPLRNGGAREAMQYKIEPINNDTFDNADPQTRKTIVLLGISTYENMPRSDVVFHDRHNDARLKQKEDTINHLEEELRNVREKHAANLKHELHLRETETSVRLKHQQQMIDKLDQENRTMRDKHNQEIEDQITNARKRFDMEYQRVESMNAKLNEDIKRLLEDRDKYVQEQVDRTADVYKEQLKLEKEKMVLQESFNSRLKEELESFRARKTTSLVSVGMIGELQVKQFVESNFHEGQLSDMTKNPDNADYHFEYKGARILIEVKNYTSPIPSHTIDKFYRNTHQTKVDGAIIVSCVDGIRFPNRNPLLDWGFYQNTPTLFITDFFSNPMILYGGILAMVHYIRSKKEFEKDNTESAQKHKEMCSEILGDIETWVPLADKATKQAKSTWETMNDLNQKIMNRLSKYDTPTSALKANHNTTLTDTEVFQIAFQCFQKLGRLPSAKDLMENKYITQTVINKVGGMKSICKYIQSNADAYIL